MTSLPAVAKLGLTRPVYTGSVEGTPPPAEWMYWKGPFEYGIHIRT